MTTEPIKHVLREELDGGFWLIRDEGRAIELSDLEFDFMASQAVAAAPSPPTGRPSQAVAAAPSPPTGRPSQAVAPRLTDDRLALLRANLRLNGGDQLLQHVDRQGLHQAEAWESVRLVKADVAREFWPTDAVVAPKRIYFEITRGCNLRCKSCFNQSGARLPDELTNEEILEVNRQAYDLGVFEIRYTGGECTTVPGFAEVVADARRRGLYISIGTNGVYTDEQLEWLPDCGIDWFIISLDGDQQTNDQVRGEGTYDGVLRTLEHLARNPALRIRLNMVVAKHNVSAIEPVARVAERFGVSSLNLIPLRPYGRSTTKMTNDMFAQRDFYAFIREVNRLRRQFPGVTFSTTIDLLDPDATTSHDLMVQKKTTCAAGVEACVIGPQGHVYGCSYSPASFPNSADEEGKRIFIAGNIREDDLGTIWRDSARWAVFRDLTKYKNPKCHTCSHYTTRCSGSCQIMAWYQLKHQQDVADGNKEIGDFYDPYCFVDILDEQEQGQTADLSAPCGGAGMDSF